MNQQGGARCLFKSLIQGVDFIICMLLRPQNSDFFQRALFVLGHVAHL